MYLRPVWKRYIQLHFAAFYVVGSDVSCYFTFISGAVDGNNRNLCLVGCQNGVRNSCRVYRVYDEDRDISLEQVGNIIGLLSRVILGIYDFHIYACFVSCSFYAVSHSNKEGIILGGNRETNGDFLGTGSCTVSFLVRRAAACCGNESCADKSSQCDFL